MSLDRFESLAKATMACNACFNENTNISRAAVCLPQPRYIGAGYWSARPRVCIVMINPGSGAFRADGMDQIFLQHLREYAGSGDVGLEKVFVHQRSDFDQWGRGRFASRVSALGLSFDNIALLNIAWCSTSGNNYPAGMLKTCYEKHTSRALEILDPSVVLLLGGPAHTFSLCMQNLLPNAQVICMLHYAHRESYERECEEVIRIRGSIRAARERR